MRKNDLKGINLRILPYAHCDYAALHTRYWHKIRYNEIFDKVMELMDKMPNFRWYFDCYRSQLQALFEKYPEKKARFDKFIREKKLNFIGAYSNLRPNMVGEETYLQNFNIIRDILPDALCEVYGEEVDVAFGNGQIPQILKQFGYELYKIYRPNDVLDAKNIPSSFRWKGFDGSVIDVVRSDYSAFDKKGTEDIVTIEDAKNYLFDNAKDCIEKSNIDLVWVNCGCDDVLPFVTNQANNEGKVFDIDMQKVLSLYSGENGGTIKLSSPLEFYNELKKYENELKTYFGTLDCADVSYNIAINGEKGFVPLRLKADELLTRAERWQIFAKQLDISIPYDFNEQWRQLLTCCSHATQWLFEEDFSSIKNRLNSIIYNANAYIQKLADEISKRIDANKYCLKTIFNDSPYEFYKIVTLKIPCADLNELILKDGKNESIDYEVIGTHDYNNTWEYIIQAKILLPKYGFNTIYAFSGDVRALYGKREQKYAKNQTMCANGTNIINGAGFSLVFLDGDLIKINQQTTTQENPFNLLTLYEYPYCGSWWEHYANKKTRATWSSFEVVKATEKFLKIKLRGTIDNEEYIQVISANKEYKKLDFEIILDWKGGNKWLTASVPTDGCNNVFCDTPFGTQYVNVDAEYSDRIFEKCIAHRKRKGVIVAKNFIQSKLNEKNVSILKGNSDRYFQCDVELKNLGIILLNSIERIESLWERDINDDIEAKGKHKLTYSVCFEDCAKENVDKFLENVFFSDLSRENPNYSTLLPPFYSFFDIKGNGIDVTSFREKNSGDYLRVVETIGKGQTIYFSKNNYISCEAQRLSGESISLLIEKENYFSYELKPYEIVTFLLKKK